MAINIEDHFPNINSDNLNTKKAGQITAPTGSTDGIDYSASSGTWKAPSGSFIPTGGVAAGGGFSASPRTVWAGNIGPDSLTAGTDTAITTTDTYIAECFIPCNMTITGVSVLQGTTTGNGHISVALANSSGTVVASSATTTTTGTATTFTKVAFSSTYAAVGPATYYILVQGDSTSDHLRLLAAGNFGASIKTSETYGTFTTITPPTTFTAANGAVASLY